MAWWSALGVDVHGAWGGHCLQQGPHFRVKPGPATAALCAPPLVLTWAVPVDGRDVIASRCLSMAFPLQVGPAISPDTLCFLKFSLVCDSNVELGSKGRACICVDTEVPIVSL